MEKQTIINLNQTIKVKLKESGYQLLAEQHNEFLGTIHNWKQRTSDYYKKQADSDGYTQFQLWCFMKDFGDTISMGFNNHFYPDIILIKD